MMVDQEHQVDQDLVVVRMDMIMDLLVLVLVVLQVVILVEVVQEVQVTLVKEVVAQVVLVKMVLDLDHNKLEDLVVLVFHFPQHSKIPIKLLDRDLEVQLHTTGLLVVVLVVFMLHQIVMQTKQVLVVEE